MFFLNLDAWDKTHEHTGSPSESDDLVTPEEAIKDPLVLEFLALKDEYSKTD